MRPKGGADPLARVTLTEQSLQLCISAPSSQAPPRASLRLRYRRAFAADADVNHQRTHRGGCCRRPRAPSTKPCPGGSFASPPTSAPPPAASPREGVQTWTSSSTTWAFDPKPLFEEISRRGGSLLRNQRDERRPPGPATTSRHEGSHWGAWCSSPASRHSRRHRDGAYGMSKVAQLSVARGIAGDRGLRRHRNSVFRPDPSPRRDVLRPPGRRTGRVRGADGLRCGWPTSIMRLIDPGGRRHGHPVRLQSAIPVKPGASLRLGGVVQCMV